MQMLQSLCQNVTLVRKPRHVLRPPGQLQSLPIPAYPWQHVTVDFITGLPVTLRGYDCIAVIVDRLTKFVCFVPTTTNVNAEETAHILFQLFVI